MEKKTPLYACHERAGGKMVPFAGYLLPVQYKTGVIAEHMAVRTACGLFDVSHMGEVILKGADALHNLQKLLTNDMSGMAIGRVRYSPMCNEEGGVVDDLIAYKIAEDCYLIVVNAANREKDVAWMRDHLEGDVSLTDISDGIAQLALQGPRAQEILEKLTDETISRKSITALVREAPVGGIACLISRTGYTGEDGFELYCACEDAERLWELLLEAGAQDGLIPCGLGARDTLRLEAAMPLYGHEMNDAITPLETGLGMFVKLQKEEPFIGREAILRNGRACHRTRRAEDDRAGHRARALRGVPPTGKRLAKRRPARTARIWGRRSPMALVAITNEAPGTAVEVDVRGRRIAAEVVPLPFYKRSPKA